MTTHEITRSSNKMMNELMQHARHQGWLVEMTSTGKLRWQREDGASCYTAATPDGSVSYKAQERKLVRFGLKLSRHASSKRPVSPVRTRYACTFKGCDLVFETKDERNMHEESCVTLKSEHAPIEPERRVEEAPIKTGRTPLPCPYCSRYITPQNLSRHIAKHERETAPAVPAGQVESPSPSALLDEPVGPIGEPAADLSIKDKPDEPDIADRPDGVVEGLADVVEEIGKTRLVVPPWTTTQLEAIVRVVFPCGLPLDPDVLTLTSAWIRTTQTFLDRLSPDAGA